jgi:hypothetical protein
MSKNEFDPFQGFDGGTDSKHVRDPLADIRDGSSGREDGEFERCGEEHIVIPVEDEKYPEREPTQSGRVGVEDESMGEFNGQELRPSNEQMTRGVVSENAPVDDRVGPDTGGRLEKNEMLDLTPEGLETSPMVQQEKAVGREKEIERTHLRSMDDREERTREVVIEDTADDGWAGLNSRTPSTDKPNVPLGDLPADIQLEAAREAKRMYDDAEWPVTDARVFQWALGESLRSQTGEKDVSRAVTANLDLVKRSPMTKSVSEVNTVQEGGRLSVKGKVAVLWENDDDDIRQVGLLADREREETIKFTIWESASEEGLTTHYSEPGFPSCHEAAVRGRLEEGDVVTLEDVTQTWDDQGRPCLEVDRKANRGGRRDVTTV